MIDLQYIWLASNGIIIALIIAAILLVVSSRQADKAIRLVPKLEEEGAVEKRIAEKRSVITDLDADLEERRKRLEVHSDLQLEVDALARKKDELLSEYAQLEPRKQELDALRLEAETLGNERLALNAELIEGRAELEQIQSQLAERDGLTNQIAFLTEQKQNIETELAGLNDRREELRGAEKELAQLAEERTRLSEENATLNARKIALEEDIAALRKQSVQGGESEEADPLRELNAAPPVVTNLRQEARRIGSEAEALDDLRTRLRTLGLNYTDRLRHAFHTAMKVNDTTQMAVLAGISGTGKSLLPRQYAAAMGIGFLQVPVQPRWDSPQDLMGFYNYIEGRFRPTEMARALWALDQENNPEALQDRMLMVLLDEMNLARVEYYFSDFLSRLESRPSPDEMKMASRRKDAEIELEIPNLDPPKRILPGYNLLFAGTMNEDESTQSLSDKVLDRANLIRFGAPSKLEAPKTDVHSADSAPLSTKTWAGWCIRAFGTGDQQRVDEKISEMLDIMKKMGRPFGHRLGRAISAYVRLYPEIQGDDRLNVALADQIEMRLLPKLRGVDVEEKRGAFDELCRLAEGLGDTQLAAAIAASTAHAENTGQFVWLGVTR